MKTHYYSDAIMREKFRLKYGFFIDVDKYSGGISTFKDIDCIFESTWVQLKSYFIPPYFFGENDIKSKDNREFQNFDDRKWTKDDFEIDSSFEEYIKSIFKRYCIINALDWAKKIDADEEYVSLYHVSQVWKDCGYFTLTKNTDKKNLLYRFQLGGKNSIDKQMHQKLNPQKIKIEKKTISPGRYQTKKRKDFFNLIEDDKSNQRPCIKKKDKEPKSEYSHNLEKEGKRFNTYAKRYRKKDMLGYTNNNVIQWKNNKQHVPFNDIDLVYSMLNGNVSDFESDLMNLSEIDGNTMTKVDKNKIEKCLRSHFTLVNSFRDYSKCHEHMIIKDKHNILGDNVKAVKSERISFIYDKIDTLLLNNSIEKYYHIDLLYEIIYLRRNIDTEFDFDNNLYDDILIELTRMPIPFARILFAEYAANRKNAKMFYENKNSRSMVQRAVIDHRLALNKKYQQLEWVNSFEKYIKQLTGVYIPLLEKTFISSLYSNLIDSKPSILASYNKELLDLLYKYTNENIKLFLFDTNSDKTFNKYYYDIHNIKEDKIWNYMDVEDFSQHIHLIKEKIKKFLSDEISALSDSEYMFMYKFYRTIFNQKGFNAIFNNDLFDRFDKMLRIRSTKKNYFNENSEEVIYENYRKDKAKLDIEFITSMPFISGRSVEF